MSLLSNQFVRSSKAHKSICKFPLAGILPGPYGQERTYKMFFPASLLIPIDVQPPSALSISFPTNTSSLLQFRARISSKENPDPAATPLISSLFL